MTAPLVQRAGLLLDRHLGALDPMRCGFGNEPGIGHPNDDPMAWSLYGRGFLKLWKVGGSPSHRVIVERAIARLSATRSPRVKGIAWGLPYPWKGHEANHPYAITTAMCGDFLLDAARAGFRFDTAMLEDRKSVV